MMRRAGWLKGSLMLILLAPLAMVISFWLHNTLYGPTGSLFSQDTPAILLALGRLSALVAMYGVFLQILFIGRVRWVEQVFGMDRLSRFHHHIALPVVILLLAHPIMLTIGSSLQFEVGLIAQTVDYFKNWEDVSLAYIGLLLILVAAALSGPLIHKRLPYEWWYRFHLLLYIGFLLAIPHQMDLGGDFTMNAVFKHIWAGLFIFVGLHLLYFRFWTPMRRFIKHRFAVDEVVQETPDVTSVYIRSQNLDQLPAQAGQFVIVRFVATGFWMEAHPFSLSAPPDGKRLRLSIKKLGDFTGRIPLLKKGTPVIIDGPHGVFTAKKAQGQKVLLVAGGIGITPIRSICEPLAKAGKDVVLIYGNRTQSTLVFEKELTELSRKYPNIKLAFVLSHEPTWKGETGFVDKERIQRLAPDFLERDIFVCGPPIMMMGIVKTLREMKVPASQIHYERFAL